MLKKFLGIFLLLYIPLLVLSLLMLAGQRRARMVEFYEEETSVATNKTYFLSDVCQYLAHNTMYWTSIKYPVDFDPLGLDKEFLQPYLDVLKNLGFYDQFRIIDLNGEEMLRYQSNEGREMELAQSQNKVHREYVREGLKLNKGEVYLSRINLNRENGEIEQPYKPVLRSVGPIYDSNSNKLGLVVINFRMEDILKPIVSFRSKGNTYLVDSDLSIVSASTTKYSIPNEVKEFQDSLKGVYRLEDAGLQNLKDTTFISNGTIWSLHKLDLTKGALRNSAVFNEPKALRTTTDWAVVRELPEEEISKGLWPIYQNFMVLHLFSIVALSGIAYGYLKYQQTKLKLVGELKDKNESLLQNKSELEMINKQVKQSNLRLKIRNEQLEQFSYLISHNLRSPVTNMTVILDMLKKQNDVSGVQALLPKLESIASSVFNLTEDVRYYISILDRNEVDLKEINFRKLVEKVRGDFSESVLDNDNFKILYDLKEWDTIIFSKYYMKSIIHNLLSNAIRFRNKEVDSYVKFRTSYEKGKRVLYVEDNGLGIDLRRHKHNVFRLYRRFHRDISGKGMGLFLIKTLLESLDASVSVKSIVGKGTSFKIIF
ncbi:sensor histidine kinase [Euzebyella saccharophila]|uniref:histidine kinase n=1 Tax=Euzebyella saccharophila TaxID=679664 RepID=A0ABV8JIK9_9FLAO|nr:sensor histidine kinase [Euzebyella saccharophila]